LVLTDDPTPAVDLVLAGGRCKVHLERDESSVAGDRKLVVSAAKVEIRATQQLTLSGAQVEITAAGSLSLSGKPIKLN
jgi:hypothetical protein